MTITSKENILRFGTEYMDTIHTQDTIDGYRDRMANKIASLYPIKERDTHTGEVIMASGHWLKTCMRMKAGIGLEAKEYNRLVE